MSREFFMFPAAFVEDAGGFVPVAMTSKAYGTKYDDPQPNMVIVPPGMIDHREILDFLGDAKRGICFTQMLMGPAHSLIHNKPETLVILFDKGEDREAFKKEFAF